MHFIYILCEAQFEYFASTQPLLNCYTTDTEAQLFPSNKTICFVLQSYNNADCAILPKGLKITAQLSAFESLSPKYEPVGYIYDFSYSSTTKICVPCLDNVCTTSNFQLSQKAHLRLESRTHYTAIACGKVSRVQSDFENCFSQDSYLEFKSNKMCYNAIFSGSCAQLTGAYTVVNATVQLPVQSFYYDNTVVDSTFTGLADRFEICFLNQMNYLNLMVGENTNANLDTFLVRNGIKFELKGETNNLGIPTTALAGYSNLDYYISETTVQLFGTITADGQTYQNFINTLVKPTYHCILDIKSNDKVLDIKLKSDMFEFADDAPTIFEATKTQIASISKYTADQLQIVVTYFALVGNDVKFSFKQQVAGACVMSCWKSVTARWLEAGISLEIEPSEHKCSFTDQLLADVQLVVDHQFTLTKNMNISVKDQRFTYDLTADQISLIEKEGAIFQVYLNSKKIENVPLENYINLKSTKDVTFQLIILFACVGACTAFALIQWFASECLKKFMINYRNNKQMKEKMQKLEIE
ncbi:Conserved_hypothetical protein [Hexamita inflata]|uniref:Transmembrane protein n=1 Tax=Hexamita inflata TaxID=28002 RepID=A0ABP1H1G6_9EUKA